MKAYKGESKLIRGALAFRPKSSQSSSGVRNKNATIAASAAVKALCGSRLMTEMTIPSASEKNNVLQSDRSVCWKSSAATPPRTKEKAITGKIARRL